VIFGRRRQRSQSQQGETGEVSQGPTVSFSILPSETAARQAAAGGSPVEMNRLGAILQVNGRVDEAVEWFRKAAEAGNDDAAANLARHLLAQGRDKEAAEWFRRAGGPLGEALAERLDPDSRRGR
jgi:uncharacterized protein